MANVKLDHCYPSEILFIRVMQYILLLYQFWTFFPWDYFYRDVESSGKQPRTSLFANAILANTRHCDNRI